VLFLFAYAGLFFLLAWLSGRADFFSNEFFWLVLGAGWIAYFVLPLWLLVAINLIRWWYQRRGELVRRTLVWDSLLWLGVLILGLFLRATTRAWLIPPRTTASNGSVMR
jgi:hypothetical protein